MALHLPDHYWVFSSSFFLFLFWDGFIMGLHGVDLLYCVFELYGFSTLVATGAGLFVLVWMLRGALLGVFFKDSTLFRGVPGSMQQACIFRTGRIITRMACIVSLALSVADLLGILWQGGLFYLFLPAITFKVGFFPLIIFRKWSLFVDSLRDFRALKHIACILVGPFFKILYLYVDFCCPHKLSTAWRRILFNYSGSIFLLELDPGKSGR